MQFLQSFRDFPQMVRLGEKSPSFGLHRFRQGLRFVPSDDEGFTLRGDKQRLTYKGRQRSHRFTILGDGSFEYDCILLKEPDTNTISLRMEGAENYDFFRQPDFVKNPFLKGSYAVYKKETLIGEGTGKLCHIHRPEIIDARGRRCWGSLSLVGNELRITVPEQWLSEASYPVIVDPKVGTTTVGAFWENFDDWWIDEDDGEIEYNPNYIDQELIVNRYQLPEQIKGQVNAFFYSNSQVNLDTFPVLYKDGSNYPTTKLSVNECELIWHIPWMDECWYTSTFNPKTTIASGSYVWFGMYSSSFEPRYDYGAKCYREYVDYGTPKLPNNYPLDSVNEYYDFKFSMYFYYNNSITYTRFLTQRVREHTWYSKVMVAYKRILAQTVKGSTVNKSLVLFLRLCKMTVANSMNIFAKIPVLGRLIIDNTGITDGLRNVQRLLRKFNEIAQTDSGVKRKQEAFRQLKDNVQGNTVLSALVSFFRQCVMSVSNIMRIERLPVFFRSVFDCSEISEGISHKREIARRCGENACISGEVNRSKGFFREIIDSFNGADNNDFNILFIRSVNETQGITDSIQKLGDYIRALYIEAGSIAETAHSGTYYRKESDRVQAEGSVFRHLSIFLRILTKTFIKDYLIGRFLIAREELKLKSCIVRDIVLESRIN